MSIIQQAKQALATRGILEHFMPHVQRISLLKALNGEEAQGIAEVVMRAATIVATMPTSYKTDGQGDEAIAHLHYFLGSIDAWITERDVGDSTEGSGIGEQHQAFGKINLDATGIKYAELGYISIAELIENGVELDLYWTPKKLKEIK